MEVGQETGTLHRGEREGRWRGGVTHTLSINKERDHGSWIDSIEKISLASEDGWYVYGMKWLSG